MKQSTDLMLAEMFHNGGKAVRFITQAQEGSRGSWIFLFRVMTRQHRLSHYLGFELSIQTH